MSNYRLYFESFGNPINQIKSIKNKPRDLKSAEILVEMLLAPINPSDLIPISGAYASRTSLPSQLGYEGIGIVRNVYDSKNTYLIGKKVLPLRGEGTWQKYVITKAEYAVIVPDGIEDYVASQCYINPVTALVLCTEVFHLKNSEYLLINASNSSIGKTVIQLSKILGFNVISVIRNEKDKIFLKELGSFSVINASEISVYKKVMAITNGVGVKAAIDSIGGIAGTELARCVQKDGIFRTIGILSGEQVDWIYIRNELLISSGIFHLRHWINESTINEWQKVFVAIFDYIEQGQLIIPKPKYICPITSYKKAIDTVSKKSTSGKILFSF